jgi:hypothetical protein
MTRPSPMPSPRIQKDSPTRPKPVAPSGFGYTKPKHLREVATAVSRESVPVNETPLASVLTPSFS